MKYNSKDDAREEQIVTYSFLKKEIEKSSKLVKHIEINNRV